MTDSERRAAVPAAEPAATAAAAGGVPPKLTHLIHVGYPKTGSKSLQHWFEQHPQVAFAQWAIAGAPDVFGFVDRFAFGADMRCAVTSYEAFVIPAREQRRSDFDDVASLVPRREWIVRLAETLATLFREPRILIVTRGFRDLCLSYYAEVVALGGTRSFEDFCAGFFLADAGRAAIDYDFIIGLYERLFGAENVLVLPYELLREDPGAFIRPIEAAAGLAAAVPPPAWLHRSLSPDELDLYPRLGRMLLSLPVGAGPRRWLHRRYLGLVQRRRGRLVLSLMKRLAGVRPVGPQSVPGPVVERFRGTAERLRGRPAYGGFEGPYLL